MINITPLTKKSKKKSPKDHVENIKKFLVSMDVNWEQEIHTIYLLFCTWISRMESNLTSNITFKGRPTQDFEHILQYRTKLLMTGSVLYSTIF